MSEQTVFIEPCPECIAGKCANCDGRSWDKAQDVVAACPCARAAHPRSGPSEVTA